MASTATVSPTLGHYASFTQTGVTAGYDAIDARRIATMPQREGILSDGSYAVSQRAAGANLSVDVAASTGLGAYVQGDSVSAQGLYHVPPSSAVLNVDIPTGDASNPTNHLVVLEVKDNTHDGGGSDTARVRVISGTPNASAALTDAFGVNGTPALPSNCLPLAVVRMAAAATTAVTAAIDDRRYRTSGTCVNTALSETFTPGASYAHATTPDRVRNIVLPTAGLIVVAFQATWQNSVASAGRAAIHLASTQAQLTPASGSPAVQEAIGDSVTGADRALCSGPVGLIGGIATTTGDVATGQIIGLQTANTAGSGLMNPGSGGVSYLAGGPCYIFATAGTYDVSVKYKASTGTITRKNPKLFVWTMAFPG